ncbi:MAG: MBL fold metallo-hydrolase [Candidatus Gracilibacteria bacterium]|nr:MBL fold metallo-hydrolase [Candidatus Gracilibacteria bacterium]
MKKIFRFLKLMGKMLLLSSFTLIISGIIFLNLHPVFGGNPDKTEDKIQNSPNFKNGKFQNINNVSITNDDFSFKQLGEYFFTNGVERTPKNILLSKEFNKENFLENNITWFGHSSVLFNTGSQNIITDPIFSRASPVPVFGKPFETEDDFNAEVLPHLDIVLISHDHYDHLDYKTILEIDKKAKKYLVPLGVKAHFKKWGIDENKVIEFDWYDEIIIGENKFVFTPTQHFSGRGPLNRASTLWGSWAIKNDEKSYFFSGDTGYFDEFKKIGEKYGPFDIVFIENGAYNESWSQIHMMPEQSVQVGIDLNAKQIMPIHWAKFDLSLHSWTEPIERFTKEAKKKNIKTFHPQIGEIFDENKLPTEKWWLNIEDNQ